METENQSSIPETTVLVNPEEKTAEIEGFTQIDPQPIEGVQEVEKTQKIEGRDHQEEAGPYLSKKEGKDLSASLISSDYSYKPELTSKDTADIEIVQEYLKFVITTNTVCVALRVLFFIFMINPVNLILTGPICYWLIHVLLVCKKTLKLSLSYKRDFEEYQKTIKKVNFLTKVFLYLGVVMVAIFLTVLSVMLFVASHKLSRRNTRIEGHLSWSLLLVFFIIWTLLLAVLPYGLVFCRMRSVLRAMNNLRDRFDEGQPVGGLDTTISNF